MTEKEKLAKDLFDLKLRQLLYHAKHKAMDDDLLQEEASLKKEYARKIMIKRFGDGNYDKY